MKQTLAEVPVIDKARQYAIKKHHETNHFYGANEPYSVHLKMVFDVAKQYEHLLTYPFKDDILAACWTHDVIEDCRQTFNDVKQATNENVAELTYAVTNEKGRNRKQRANGRYYAGIRLIPGAVFIKLCDRIANAQYSKDDESHMLRVYRSENEEFIRNLGNPQEFAPMIKHLERILS